MSQEEKDSFLQEIYNFSSDTKLFLENRLLGGNDDTFEEITGISVDR